MERQTTQREVLVTAGDARLHGTLAIPERAAGLVMFAHGSGSSRHSPRNRHVARLLQESGLATLLMDLLTPQEAPIDASTGRLRFDIGLLAARLVGATDWIERQPDTRALPLGLFGASTGAAAALVAAARRPEGIHAVVSRGGRPDLAGLSLPAVRAATLLVVGGADRAVIPLNCQALDRLGAAEKHLEIVPGAGHLFEEPGALEQVAALARDWLLEHLKRSTASVPGGRGAA
jgi:dienelactone hydrolase